MEILKALITLLFKRKPENSNDSANISNAEVSIKSNPVAISLEAYFTEANTGEDRRQKYKSEFDLNIENNAKELLEKINAFLAELGVITCRVSSGWRPPSVNSKVPGAAKKSLHMEGKAIDIVDSTGELDKKIVEKEEWLIQHGQPSLLRKYGLWLEHPDSTGTWCHLDCGNRVDRPLRVFRVK